MPMPFSVISFLAVSHRTVISSLWLGGLKPNKFEVSREVGL